MTFVDLHTHTTASDGTLTPTELVKKAADIGLSAVAITDHDTTDGLSEGLRAGANFGIEVIPGIEISADYNGKEVHIVGLFIDKDNSELSLWLKELVKTRNDRNRLMLDTLASFGVLLDERDIEGSGTITRANIAAAMLKKGYVSSINEAFARYLGDNCKAYVKRERPKTAFAINMIKNSGGVAVLAHPLLYKMGDRTLKTMLSTLKNEGLTAVEAYYSTHSTADTAYIKRLAQENSLLLSGGSDYHGKNKPNLELGTGYGKLCVPCELLENLRLQGDNYGKGSN